MLFCYLIVYLNKVIISQILFSLCVSIVYIPNFLQGHPHILYKYISVSHSYLFSIFILIMLFKQVLFYLLLKIENKFVVHLTISTIFLRSIIVILQVE